MGVTQWQHAQVGDVWEHDGVYYTVRDTGQEDAEGNAILDASDGYRHRIDSIRFLENEGTFIDHEGSI